jgi:DNA-binding HxlR family transcriptional regulator
MKAHLIQNICPVTTVIELLSRKWALSVLRCLHLNGKHRFGEIQSEISVITPRVLSKRLRELIETKLVNKESFNETPPRVEYSLTDSGKDLIKIFKILDEWATKWGHIFGN